MVSDHLGNWARLMMPPRAGSGPTDGLWGMGRRCILAHSFLFLIWGQGVPVWSEAALILLTHCNGCLVALSPLDSVTLFFVTVMKPWC